MTEKIIETSDKENIDKKEYALDFTTSSAIGRVSIKFLVIYIPIFWFSGLLVGIYLYEYFKNLPPITEDWMVYLFPILFLPVAIFSMLFIFILGCIFFSKLFLILINLIHKPKEGIFLAQKGDKDFEFWCMRTELKKLVMWLVRNCPLPWIDTLAFRWFGVKMDFSSHLQDSWCDMEFIQFGRKVLVGQGAVVMSSMVVGKYLIIKKLIFSDYTIIGGMACVSPGTISGKDSFLGALSATVYGQFLETEWIYFGIPCIKLKPNRLGGSKFITKSIVDDEQAISIEHEINIEEDKKDKINI
ncbi:MAG: hypothetical protein EU529_10855 [Promethearchaeota archaeon]|nr:MAG: hypothetical protein EU529_10855 [Candidatus Lokiarchaeota archaeon]